VIGTLEISLFDVQAKVKKYSAFIDSQNIKYVARAKPGKLGANSNSYAFSFVSWLGFTGITPLAGVAAPGWNVPLPEPTDTLP
jgi:hypothetical protein